MIDSKAETRKIQIKPETSCVARRYESDEKGGDMLKGHRSQPKRAPLATAETVGTIK